MSGLASVVLPVHASGVADASAVAAANAPADAGASAPASTDADNSAVDAVFDRNLLSGHRGDAMDLARFERGNPVLPGIYNLDIYLLDTWVGRSDVRFVIVPGHKSATACLSRTLLDQLGLHLPADSKLPLAALDRAEQCVTIGQIFAGATATADMPELRLVVSVPQAFLGQQARGYVSPQYWDQGLPSAVFNYTFNAYRTSNQGLIQSTAFLALGTGLNLGSWHLRQDSTLNWAATSGGGPSSLHWQDIDLYARHDVPRLRAQLTLGDSYTDGQVFDSFGIRGVQLATDDRMLPDSLRGYAPVIRGVANSNARVVVSQHGLQIYQTTVAPGPFAISDLYPTGYGGSLDVTITEADGSVRTFSVPYASVAQLLRPGISRFDIALGQLRNVSLQHRPALLEGTYQRGFSNSFTGYAGLLAAQNYAAAVVGGAFNTRFGAVAVDITQADTRISGYGSFSGQSVRISYSKIVPQTDTSFSVAAYRYSTSGYFDLADAALAQDEARRGINVFGPQLPPILSLAGQPITGTLTAAQQAALTASNLSTSQLTAQGLQRARGTFTLTMSQRFGASGGSLYANVSTSDYWNQRGTNTQFQVGYNNHLWRVSYNLSATRTRDLLGRNDNEFLLSFTIPLGHGVHAPNLGLNLTHDGQGGAQEQAMLNGAFGADNQFSYGASATHGDLGSTGTLNGGYRSAYGVGSLSYGEGPGYTQSSLGLSGTVVAHRGGVTFGQPAGDTLGLVYAPGAHGAAVLNASGARIDRGGYALVPYLTPYNLNTIQLDPKGLPLDVELDASGAQVAPHLGAVVLIAFKTKSGRTVVAHLRSSDGSQVPFGTEIVDSNNNTLGVVGQSGQALLRGIGPSGRLYGHWKSDTGIRHDCGFDYQSPAAGKHHASRDYPTIDAVCTPLPAVSAGKEGL